MPQDTIESVQLTPAITFPDPIEVCLSVNTRPWRRARSGAGREVNGHVLDQFGKSDKLLN